MKNEKLSSLEVASTEKNLVFFTASVFSPEVIGIFSGIYFLEKGER